MVDLAYCVGRRNLSWIGRKYQELSAEIYGVRRMTHMLLEVYQVLEGNASSRYRHYRSACLRGSHRSQGGQSWLHGCTWPLVTLLSAGYIFASKNILLFPSRHALDDEEPCPLGSVVKFH